MVALTDIIPFHVYFILNHFYSYKINNFCPECFCNYEKMFLHCGLLISFHQTGKNIPMGPGSIPSPGAVCAFGFQSILASAGFLRVLRFSLLHLKLDFLNKSVSKHFMEASLKFNAFALLGFAWFPPNVINKCT